MPMSVELRILVSIMYSTQVTMPGMTDGITPWNTVWMKFAPDAWSASIQEELASSMVSINAWVSIPNVVKNRAKNPVRMSAKGKHQKHCPDHIGNIPEKGSNDSHDAFHDAAAAGGL